MLTPAATRRVASMRRQCGLSLVEMMVGIAVGLFVVAVATVMVASQLSENRRLLVDTQLQQDLRATADIVTRELRRSGAWADSQFGVSSNAFPDITANPYTAITTVAGATGAVTYRYQQGNANADTYGFRLLAGVIQARLSTTASYQSLTDESTMVVDTFAIAPDPDPSPELPIACPKPCADGTQHCWPTLVVRYLRVDITAHALSDVNVTRSISTSTRVRNDVLQFNDPAHPAQFCPA